MASLYVARDSINADSPTHRADQARQVLSFGDAGDVNSIYLSASVASREIGLKSTMKAASVTKVVYQHANFVGNNNWLNLRGVYAKDAAGNILVPDEVTLSDLHHSFPNSAADCTADESVSQSAGLLCHGGNKHGSKLTLTYNSDISQEIHSLRVYNRADHNNLSIKRRWENYFAVLLIDGVKVARTRKIKRAEQHSKSVDLVFTPVTATVTAIGGQGRTLTRNDSPWVHVVTAVRKGKASVYHNGLLVAETTKFVQSQVLTRTFGYVGYDPGLLQTADPSDGKFCFELTHIDR